MDDGGVAHTALRRLRPRTDHAGAVPTPRPRAGRPGRTRCARSCGHELACDRDGQPVRPRSRDLHAARAAHRRAQLHRDQLLHRHRHRAAPRPRRRAAGGRSGRSCGWTSRATSGRSSSRWPVDLEVLFGVDIHEMQPYRPDAPSRSPSSSPLGRTMTVELDAWYLPDTAATSYRDEHVKTWVIAESIDVDGGALPLLPQRGLLRARRQGLPRRLPPRDRLVRRRPAPLHRAGPLRRGAAAPGRGAARRGARGMLRGHLERRPCPATRSTASASA